jgi:hypothetical protein
MRPLSQWTRRTVGLVSLAWLLAGAAALALWVGWSIAQLRAAFQRSAAGVGGTMTSFGVDLHAPLRDWLPLLAVYGTVVLAPAVLFVLAWRWSRRGAQGPRPRRQTA